MERINHSGQAFLSHTRLRGKYTIRAVFGQPKVEQSHVDQLLGLLREHL
jgi:aromatic-L-amino-acid decarboxylase